MNIKLPLTDVVSLLDHRISIHQVCKQLQPIAQQAQLLFVEPQTGSGYLQWTLQGDDWQSFTKGNDDQKAAVAQVFQDRKGNMEQFLGASPLKETIFSMPSPDYIYFRPSGESWDIALTAWAYRFPDKPACRELDTWIVKKALQDVCIGFTWQKAPLPNYSFKLTGLLRTTDSDGRFPVDKPLPVGNTYPIETLDGRPFQLTVEQGRSDYVFDLTQYVTVHVSATQDGTPCSELSCQVQFGEQKQEITLDETGNASVQLPLVGTDEGLAKQPQPSCIVSCKTEEQQQTPTADGETLHYAFRFEPPKKKQEPPVKKEQEEKEPPKPDLVTVRLVDYGGFPMPDLPFILTTKLKGQVQLKTDKDGLCQVPKEWFSHREKMNVKFDITPEYQAQHDLHDPKKK